MLNYVKIYINIWLIEKQAVYLYYQFKNRDMKRVCKECEGDKYLLFREYDERETYHKCNECNGTGYEEISFFEELEKIIDYEPKDFFKGFDPGTKEWEKRFEELEKLTIKNLKKFLESLED